MNKTLSLFAPLLFLAGNSLAQVAYIENSDTLFNAGTHNSTYVTGSGLAVSLGLDYYGHASGLAAPGADAWYNGAWKYR